MVSYCCVKGCSNNSNNKKKDPNTLISFHAFPSNQELKTKWLKAIGRPNWVPPSHSRVCSAHFNFDQINYDGCRIRVKEDAFPINLLPANSNFEASDVQACRICLVTDVKMYSTQGNHLGACIDTVAGLSQNYNIEGLPQYVCYQCAPCLIKCNKLIEKSLIAQATLLDIFTKNGKLNKKLIKEQNRSQLNLKSPLGSYILTDNYCIKYDEDNISHLIKSNSDNNENIYNVYLKNETDHIEAEQEIKIDLEHFETKKCDEKQLNESNDDYFNDDGEVVISPIKDEDDINDDLSLSVLKEKKYTQENCVKKKLARKKINGLTPDETDMLKYFDIVKLSLHEQINEWEKTTVLRPLTSDTVYKCQICHKAFANVNSHRVHVTSHDPSNGRAECPVCKLRFKNVVVAKSHAKRAHGKKFFCKSCPKAFNNVGVAKKHQRWHVGYRYSCPSCPFTSLHESALGVHRRRAHRGQEAKAARALHETDITKTRCEQCNMDFTSESAKRLHVLTSSQYRNKPDLCAPSSQDQRTCNKCGEECPSLPELVAHTRAKHPRLKHRYRSDIYPTHCELCGESVGSRKKHWHHVRRQHPKEMHTYRPVVCAVCDTCGKGFQNSTKLRLHQLRHRSPSVRCASCPRLFYDKYALARHARTHAADTPHQCRACGRAFKLRSNLERHARVHTDLTPYECTMCGKKFKYSSSVNLHVRTVHYKLPHPPRKKRSKTTKNIDM